MALENVFEALGAAELIIEASAPCDRVARDLHRLLLVIENNASELGATGKQTRADFADDIERLADRIAERLGTQCVIEGQDPVAVAEQFDQLTEPIFDGDVRRIDAEAADAAEDVRELMDMPESGPVACFDGISATDLERQMNLEIAARDAEPRGISGSEKLTACLLFGEREDRRRPSARRG